MPSSISNPISIVFFFKWWSHFLCRAHFNIWLFFIVSLVSLFYYRRSQISSSSRRSESSNGDFFAQVILFIKSYKTKYSQLISGVFYQF